MGYFTFILIVKIIILLSSPLSANSLEDVQPDQIPNCILHKDNLTDNSDIQIGPKSREYVLLSTIDGRLTAMDARDQGKMLWSEKIGESPLLESTLPQFFELEIGGEMYKLLPTFDGKLFINRDGNLQHVGHLTENIMKSIQTQPTGGWERSKYGLDLLTGQKYYSCNLSSCQHHNTVSSSGPTLVVVRNTHVMRGDDPHTGKEKWKFTVGDLDISLLTREGSCESLNDKDQVVDSAKSLSFDYKINLHGGHIGAFSKEGRFLWSHQLNIPIVKAWVLKNGILHHIDLLDKKLLDMKANYYVGSYNHQEYLQLPYYQSTSRFAIEGTSLKEDKASTYLQIEGPPSEDPEDPETAIPSPSPDTSLSTLDKSLPNRGYYIFINRSDLSKTPNNSVMCLKEETINNAKSEEQKRWLNWSWSAIAVSFVIIGSSLLAFKIAIRLDFSRYYIQHFYVKIFNPTPLPPPPPSYSSSDVAIQLTFSRQNSNDLDSIHKDPALLAPKPRSISESSTQAPIRSRFWDEYDDFRTLGAGGYGIVFSARNTVDSTYYAIKRIAIPKNHNKYERILREANTLPKLHHQGVVRYYCSWFEDLPRDFNKTKEELLVPRSPESLPFTDSSHVFPTSQETTSQLPSRYQHNNTTSSAGGIVFQHNTTSSAGGIVFQHSTDRALEPTEDSLSSSDSSIQEHSNLQTYLFIQMQLCLQETLKDWLSKNLVRDPNETVHIFLQIVDAVQYIHNNQLMHRDLKPSNILFGEDGSIKVGDFGLVRRIEETESVVVEPYSPHRGHTMEVGTTLYMSPEQLANQKYDQKVDIFSLGLIYLELESPSATEMEKVQKIINAKDKKQVFPENMAGLKGQFLGRLLSHDPQQRPTAAEIKNHPLFNPSSYFDSHQLNNHVKPLHVF